MGIVQATKEKTNELVDTAFNNTTAKAYEKYYARWRAICEVETNEEIDYKNPQVEIESKLCDPRNLKLIRKGRHTEEFLYLLSSDEARALYYEKDENGQSYADLENARVLSQVINGIRQKFPGRKDIARALREWINDEP